MKLHVKLYLKNALFLALLILTSALWGQGGTFPVQVIPQVTPPPPIYLSNYADASTLNSPLRVQIILNDLNIQNREVRLKTYFQGNGLSFQSNDFVTGSTSLFLEGGVPLVLTNVELAPYFKFENITGISPNVYGNAIPEGTYQICFEVYDLATGNRLSSKSCATTVVFQNEPPFLISPRNKTNVAETNPQNIVFQWTPRSINVTNVEYELSLVEIWDTQIDPQAAFLSSPPIFQTTTSATTYVFGPSDPLLLSGKNYAWRIQAKAKQGTEEIGLFKNQGYSEIFSFSHASACDLPLGINHEVKGSTIANIFWDDFSTDVPEYTVRYRKKSSSNSSQGGASEWFFNKTTSNTTSLWDLKAGTTYEYQLQKKCPITKSEWSITKQFTTHIADNEESVYECGITPDFSLSNTDPIDALEKGDKFTAGDFPINVLEVSGSKGRFTGKGYVTIPYLNSIRVGVQFTNVLINTDKQLAEGTVITLYDPSLKNILDVDDAIETVGNVAEAVGELFEGDNDLDEIHVNWDIDPDKDIKIEDGILIITNPANGAIETSPLGDDKVIVDKSGQTYHIDAEGKITKGKKIDPSGGVTNGNVTGVSNKGEIESLTAKGIQVTFESNGIYGYDIMPNIENEKLNKEYTTIPDAEGGKYTLPHIAIEKEQTIVVTAKVELSSNSEYSLEDLKFKTKVGELIHISAINEDNNSIELEVSGHYTLENETIYAVVPNKQDSTKQLTAGAFTLWHLTDRVVNVVLVSIDKAPLPDTAEIARIFKKGTSTFNFETTTASLKGTNLLGDDDRLQIADNAWLNAYNDEQNSVINQIKSQIEDFDKNKYYVLIFNTDFKTSRSVAGFMPLQRQFGFVFNGALSTGEESKGDLTAVTAHELGHGIFALQHPFTEYGTKEKATDWLMDYKDGAIELNHMNWAQMHNPALKFYVFQDEEDGEFAGAYFVTPDLGISFVQGTSTLSVSFDLGTIPTGTLSGFIKIKNDVKIAYQWKNGAYRNKYNDDDIESLPYQESLARDKKINLFYNLSSDCPEKKYLNLTFAELENITTTKERKLVVDAAGILAIIDKFDGDKTKSNPILCASPNKVTGQWYDDTTPINCEDPSVQNTLQLKLAAINAITTDTSISEANEILEKNFFTCLFESISIEQRIVLLDIFLALDSDNIDDRYWEFSNDWSFGDRFFIPKLVTSTPVDDRVKLLREGFMKNQYQWIQTLCEEGTGGNDVSIYELFPLFRTLGEWAIEYKGSLNITRSQISNITFDGIEGFETYTYFPGDQPFILAPPDWKNTINSGNITESIILQSRAEILDEGNLAGKIHFYNKYFVRDLKEYLNQEGAVQPPRVSLLKYNEAFTPFEDVTIIAGKDYPQFKFNEGETVVTPAIVAYAYQNLLNADKSEQDLRELGNNLMIAGGIIAAPFSGGSSLVGVASAIAAGGIAVGGIDKVVQQRLHDGKITPQDEMYQAWDSFYAAYGFLDAGVGITTGGVAAYNSLRRISILKSYNRFNKAYNAASIETKASLKTDFDYFKNLLGRERLANTADELAEISRIKNIRSTNKAKRLEELGYDLDRKVHVPEEADAAFKIEEEWGYFERYQAPAGSGKKGDWIGLSGKGKGKTFDEFGGSIPDNSFAVNEITRKAKSKTKYFESLDEHFVKSDYVVLNLTNLKKHNVSLYNESISYITQKYGVSKLINITQ
ncbi:hypothetical protein [Cellulophaga baltica]|uniref:hypothetical protein n=1 Tax=Cellulophaga baltica TaxID=76594 RepID=UPI0024955704|nr:hypothetical protein [Cellulophaga baltica]